MKILVTGGNGFVGRHLVKRLVSFGAEVIVTTRLGTNNLNADPFVSYQEIDYQDLNALSVLFHNEKPDYIVHLASNKERSQLNTINPDALVNEISMSVNVIYAALHLENLKRFIFVGTSDQYDLSENLSGLPRCFEPANSYGFVKSTLSLLLNTLHREIGFPVVQLIPTIIYGPGQGREMFLPSLLESLLLGKDVGMTKGEQYRDFIYVSDFIDAIFAAIFKLPIECLGMTYSICSGNPVQLIEVVKLAVEKTKANFEQVKVGELPYRSTEKMNFFSSFTLFEKDTGWTPAISLTEGIQCILDFE